MTFNLKEIIEEEVRRSTSALPRPDLDSWRRAGHMIDNNVRKQRIGVVQGPPGTGKTTVIADTFSGYFNHLGGGNILLYIAPTNELVHDMFRKVIRHYISIHKPADTTHLEDFYRNISAEVRLYGSKFYFDHEISGLQNLPNPETKIVIMTSYQRLYTPSGDFVYNLMIDEASRSPLHLPFISIADQILNETKLEGSINVVGDPRQAITIGSYFSEGGRRLLMMSYLLRGLLGVAANSKDKDEDILEEAKHSSIRGNVYEFLDTTMRMPGPSEEAISLGYYDGDLTAYNSASSRLRNYFDQGVGRKIQSQESDSLRKIATGLEDAITTDRPLLYVRVPGKSVYADYSRKYGMLYDAKRAEIGLMTAITLSATTGQPTTVVTTYVDQQLQMGLQLKRRYSELMKRYNVPNDLIKFSTAQSMLGAENHNIVAILGKEYPARASNVYDPSTLYFNEPELLNVQLSRQMKFMAIIGNLGYLASQASRQNQNLGTSKYTPLNVTSDHILNQAGFVKQSSQYRHKSNGSGSSFVDFGDL